MGLKWHAFLAGAKNVGQASITIAECLAFLDRLAQAAHIGWRRVCVGENSKLVINCINKKVSIPWSIAMLVHDIWLLASSCEKVSFIHVFREANFTMMSMTWAMVYPLRRVWKHGLLLNFLFPFYFDLFESVCPVVCFHL